MQEKRITGRRMRIGHACASACMVHEGSSEMVARTGRAQRRGGMVSRKRGTAPRLQSVGPPAVDPGLGEELGGNARRVRQQHALDARPRQNWRRLAPAVRMMVRDCTCLRPAGRCCGGGAAWPGGWRTAAGSRGGSCRAAGQVQQQRQVVRVQLHLQSGRRAEH